MATLTKAPIAPDVLGEWCEIQPTENQFHKTKYIYIYISYNSIQNKN